MSIAQDEKWLTGEEFARERRRLLDAGVPRDAPEFQELYNRKRQQDDGLYERFGKRYLEEHYGKWIAISKDGEVIVRDRPGELLAASTERFGPGNAAIRKLAEFPGLEMYH